LPFRVGLTAKRQATSAPSTKDSLAHAEIS
jgi:hypothetical protein